MFNLRLLLASIMAVLFSMATIVPANADPLDGTAFYVNPNSGAYKELAKTHTTDEKTALNKIASHATAMWYTEMNTTATVANTVSTYTQAAVDKGRVAIITLYAIPGRDGNDYSAGGFDTAAQYAAWVKQVSVGIGTRKVVVIVEPDALSLAGSLDTTRQTERYNIIKSAVSTLKTNNPNVITYIDAGNSNWVPKATMASRLTSAGIANAQGFSLNVSNFNYTSNETTYGNGLSALVGNKHFVIDTGRNGVGPWTGTDSWCNPPGRKLGTIPTIFSGDGILDAYMWVKPPGESDGTCNGGPNAGTFWWQYAVGLAS
jgi:endoglucanase